MKSIRSVSVVVFALCFSGMLAQAQDADVFFGGGYATDKALSSSTGVVSPALDASFGKVGGDLMITKKFGVGFQSDFKFSKVNYQGYQTRPIFYDVNGIYIPSWGHFSRVVPEIEAGLGGTRMTLSVSGNACTVGCVSTIPVLAISHFQLHVAAGIRFYATKHVFIRPQFDYRYVPNFNEYGSNNVPEFGAAVGWSFSEH